MRILLTKLYDLSLSFRQKKQGHIRDHERLPGIFKMQHLSCKMTHAVVEMMGKAC